MFNKSIKYKNKVIKSIINNNFDNMETYLNKLNYYEENKDLAKLNEVIKIIRNNYNALKNMITYNKKTNFLSGGKGDNDLKDITVYKYLEKLLQYIYKNHNETLIKNEIIEMIIDSFKKKQGDDKNPNEIITEFLKKLFKEIYTVKYNDKFFTDLQNEIINKLQQPPPPPPSPRPPVAPTEPPVAPTGPPVAPTEPPVAPTGPPVAPTPPPVVPPPSPAVPPVAPTPPPVVPPPSASGTPSASKTPSASGTPSAPSAPSASGTPSAPGKLDRCELINRWLINECERNQPDYAQYEKFLKTHKDYLDEKVVNECIKKKGFSVPIKPPSKPTSKPLHPMYTKNIEISDSEQVDSSINSLGGNEIPYYSFPLMTLDEFKKNKNYVPYRIIN
jgi:hypothetical protein